MKRQIVTTIKWDFSGYDGLVTSLPPPEELEKAPFIWKSLVPPSVPKLVKLMSLSIGSELLKTKWRQVGSIYMQFDRVIFCDKNHQITKTALEFSRVMSQLWRAGHIESAHGWGTDYANGSFQLAPNNKAFCEEAVMRGAKVLRALCPDMHSSSLVPRITQETYIWFPDEKPGQLKSYGEVVAAKCGLVTS